MQTTAFARPRTVAEAVTLLASGRWTPLAGGTDVLPRMRDGTRPEGLLDITALDELRGISEEGGALRVGALTTHSELAVDPRVRAVAPALAEAASVVGSPAIRNRGTIAGNLANASPAADTVPPLVAMDALVELVGPEGTRQVPVSAFAVGPGRTVLRQGELIAAVSIPVQPQGGRSVFRRLGTRRALSIAKVSVALAAVVRPDGTLTRVRVALGAVGPTVFRSLSAEAELEGRRPEPDVVESAMAAARRDAQPITDIRSNEEWRREMCGVLLRRALAALAGPAGL